MKSTKTNGILAYLNIEPRLLKTYLNIEESYGINFENLENEYYFNFSSPNERLKVGPEILDKKRLNKQKIYIKPSTEPASVKAGMDRTTEKRIRIFGCQLISEACILLKLTALNQVIALQMFHRFYYRFIFEQYDIKGICTAVLLISTKLTGELRKIRNICQVFYQILKARVCLDVVESFQKRQDAHHKTPNIKITSPIFTKWKQKTIRYERQLLKELGFELNFLNQNPLKYLFFYLKVVKASPSLAQSAWNFLLDCHRMPVSVQFPSNVIAASSLYLAIRKSQILMPDHAWWVFTQTSIVHIAQVCQSIEELYSHQKVYLKDYQQMMQDLIAKTDYSKIFPSLLQFDNGDNKQNPILRTNLKQVSGFSINYEPREYQKYQRREKPNLMTDLSQKVKESYKATMKRMISEKEKIEDLPQPKHYKMPEKIIQEEKKLTKSQRRQRHSKYRKHMKHRRHNSHSRYSEHSDHEERHRRRKYRRRRDRSRQRRKHKREYSRDSYTHHRRSHKSNSKKRSSEGKSSHHNRRHKHGESKPYLHNKQKEEKSQLKMLEEANAQKMQKDLFSHLKNEPSKASDSISEESDEDGFLLLRRSVQSNQEESKSEQTLSKEELRKLKEKSKSHFISITLKSHTTTEVIYSL